MILDNFEKICYMPSKKIFLARAGARYSVSVSDENFMQIVNRIYLLGLECAKPRVYWDVFIRSSIPDYAIPGKFSEYEKFVIFASTLGNEFDECLERTSENSVFESMLLDSWGSEALEVLNDNFQKVLEEKYSIKTLSRFSPGYEDLNISVNKVYVDLLKADDTITVLESGIMIPRKTTTCIAPVI
ncbi:MAG: methionine synthase [Fervidobacterium sp.]